MLAHHKSFMAFLLNLTFALIEIVFGLVFQSSAILADAVHDLGDALAIGGSILMQTYATRPADGQYPFGYHRWNSLAACLTSFILLLGSGLMIWHTIPAILHPRPVNKDGMLILGILALVINGLAAKLVHKGHSHNERILSLHFLEDILGWLAIIFLALVLRFTDWYILDPLLSLLISLFILYKAIPTAWENLRTLLETTPQTIPLPAVRQDLLAISGVETIEQLQVWTLDGSHHCATLTLHFTQTAPHQATKQAIRQVLASYQIRQVTIEVVKMPTSIY